MLMVLGDGAKCLDARCHGTARSGGKRLSGSEIAQKQPQQGAGGGCRMGRDPHGKEEGRQKARGGHSPAAQLRTDLSPWAITCLRGLNIKIKANFNSTKKEEKKKLSYNLKN